MHKINRTHVALLLIIVLAFFLRFYNYPNRYSLGEETIRDAVVAIEGARQLQFPLVGFFSSLGPFTFGPWYPYQLILFQLIVPISYSPWIYLGLTSVLYVFVMYKIGEQLHGKTFGLLLGFLSAISPVQIMSATHLTNPNNTHLFAALSIWIFLKITKKDVSYWWGFFLGLVIGIGINLHFQMGAFLIFPLIILFYKRKKFLYFFTASAGVITSFLPLLFFEANNHWFNTRNLLYYLQFGKNAIYVPNRWLFYIRDFWPAFWADVLGVPVWTGVVGITLFVITVGFLLYKRKVSIQYIFLLAAFVFIFVLLRFYWGPRFFGYLNFVRPFIFIFTGLTLMTISTLKFGKYVAVSLLIAIIVLSMPRIFDHLISDPFSTKMYEQVALLEEKYPDKNITIYKCYNKYSSTYNSQIYSVLFILDFHKKLGKFGAKIGLKNPNCEYPKHKSFDTIVSSPSAQMVEDLYQTVSGSELIDFSNASVQDLEKAGWKQLTFSKMYDEHMRWWFKEQP